MDMERGVQERVPSFSSAIALIEVRIRAVGQGLKKADDSRGTNHPSFVKPNERQQREA